MKVICKYFWLKLAEIAFGIVEPFVYAYNKMKEEVDNG